MTSGAFRAPHANDPESSGLVIVPAQGEDVPAITEIYNEAVREGGSTADLVPRTLEQRRQWVGAHEPRSLYPVVVVRDQNGVVLGFGSLSRFHPRVAYDGVVELSYYIAGSARHRGIGTLLVRWLLDAARERHHRMATALIYVSNAGSIALMRHFGFTRFGLLPAACYDGTRMLDMSYWYMDL